MVEGPSDELVVQRAYKDMFDAMPLDQGVDVITVRSLAFKRFLEIATILKLDVAVVTDNDGDIDALESKYEDYADFDNIKICYDRDTNYKTLEPQLLKSNSLETINCVLEKEYTDKDTLLKYMENNKTDCALKIFESDQAIEIPEYIVDAIRK